MSEDTAISMNVRLNREQLGFLLSCVRAARKKQQRSVEGFGGTVFPGSGLEARVRLADEVKWLLTEAKGREQTIRERLGNDRGSGVGGIHGSVLGAGRIFPERSADRDRSEDVPVVEGARTHSRPGIGSDHEAGGGDREMGARHVCERCGEREADSWWLFGGVFKSLCPECWRALLKRS